MELELKKEAIHPKIFIEALKNKKYGYSHDYFIRKMLDERKKRL